VFSVIQIPDDAPEWWEQLGTKRKFWFRDGLGKYTLCKFGRPATGEDWSEKLAAEFAGLLGLPHATYELGVWNNERCVISPSVVPSGCALITGNELLGLQDSSYSQSVRRFKKSAHTLDAIWKALEQSECEMPLDWDPPEGIHSAQDVFVGYLVLDTFIGNTDRHDENWALLQGPDDAVRSRHLAPTYDHASCLGCHETENGRKIRLDTKDHGRSVEAYAERSRSALYSSQSSAQPLRNFDVLTLAKGMTRSMGYWIQKLEAIDESRIDSLLHEVPADRMSQIALDFARRMLVHNRNRVLGSSLKV